MPIYEYRREDGSTFEVLQKFSDDPLTQDPDTGRPVERVLHAPAIHFKGKGFHNTDYGTRRRQKEQETSKASEGGDSGSSPDTKSETKSETKSSDAKPKSGDAKAA